MRGSLENIAILSTHGDHVTILPQEGDVLGSSKRCVHEVWGVGN